MQVIKSSFGGGVKSQPLTRREKAELSAAVEDYYKTAPNAELGAFIYNLLSQFIMMRVDSKIITVV